MYETLDIYTYQVRSCEIKIKYALEFLKRAQNFHKRKLIFYKKI